MPGTASGIGTVVGAAVSVLVAPVDIVDPVTAKGFAPFSLVTAPRGPMQTTALTATTARNFTSLAFTMDLALLPRLAIPLTGRSHARARLFPGRGTMYLTELEQVLPYFDQCCLRA